MFSCLVMYTRHSERVFFNLFLGKSIFKIENVPVFCKIIVIHWIWMYSKWFLKILKVIFDVGMFLINKYFYDFWGVATLWKCEREFERGEYCCSGDFPDWCDVIIGMVFMDKYFLIIFGVWQLCENVKGISKGVNIAVCVTLVTVIIRMVLIISIFYFDFQGVSNLGNYERWFRKGWILRLGWLWWLMWLL